MRYGWRARIGQIRPSAAIESQEEWRAVAPDGVAFIDGRLMAPAELDEAGHDQMMAEVVGEAIKIASAKADVIIQCSAPGVFQRGVGHDRVVIAEMERATGVRSTTMMTAVVDAVRQLGMRRLAVVTLYVPSLNDKLVTYLEGSGFEVAALGGKEMRIPSQYVYAEAGTSGPLAKEVLARAKGVDGILVCAAMRTFEDIERLEHDTGLPVVTSNQASLWKVLRMAGVQDRIPSLGRLLAAH